MCYIAVLHYSNACVIMDGTAQDVIDASLTSLQRSNSSSSAEDKVYEEGLCIFGCELMVSLQDALKVCTCVCIVVYERATLCESVPLLLFVESYFSSVCHVFRISRL